MRVSRLTLCALLVLLLSLPLSSPSPSSTTTTTTTTTTTASSSSSGECVDTALSLSQQSSQVDQVTEASIRNREKVRDMFRFAFRQYMAHGFPWDELRPLTCDGRKWFRRQRGTIDDVLGGFALTLVDSLDSLAVLGMYSEFYDAVDKVKQHVNFDRDVTVSVFETTIRVLGGLLSAHLLLQGDSIPANERQEGFEYNGELLHLASDLGHRLLPAFDTPTGIPFHRVNLRTGVESKETRETCTAAAGTLLLEFGLLSRLTGEPSFEAAARRAVVELWNRRDPRTGLIGNTINVVSGAWISPFASTGAGIDSFFEYLIKAYALLDDPASPYYDERPARMHGNTSLKEMFFDSLNSINEHMSFGPWHVEVHMKEGKQQPRHFYVSALQAFWPGLEALVGNVDQGKASQRAFYSLWNYFGVLPENFDLASRAVTEYGKNYFLRPELIESTMILFQQTGDEEFLAMGEKMMQDIDTRCRVSCGFAAIHDVTASSWAHENRMDSFLLAETFKYLYMLFDMGARQNRRPTTLGSEDSVALFSTEGHLFLLPSSSILASPLVDQRKLESAIASNNQSKTNHSHAGTPAVSSEHHPSSIRGEKRRKTKFQATIRLEPILTPFLETPIHVPSYVNKISSRTFVLASAQFGRQVGREDLGNTRFVVIRADPLDACSPLVNADKINNAVSYAKDLRLAQGGAYVQVAVLISRGGCSFVHKASIVGNSTRATLVFVSNKEGNKVYSMVDDGTAAERGPSLQRVSMLMAPHSLGKFLEKSSSLIDVGVPAPDALHVSHHLVAQVTHYVEPSGEEHVVLGGDKAGKPAETLTELVLEAFSILFS